MCLAIFSDPPSCFTVSTTETDFYRFIGRDNAFSVDSILAWCRQLLFAFCRLFFFGGGGGGLESIRVMSQFYDNNFLSDVNDEMISDYAVQAKKEQGTRSRRRR